MIEQIKIIQYFVKFIVEKDKFCYIKEVNILFIIWSKTWETKRNKPQEKHTSKIQHAVLTLIQIFVFKSLREKCVLAPMVRIPLSFVLLSKRVGENPTRSYQMTLILFTYRNNYCIDIIICAVNMRAQKGSVLIHWNENRNC